MEKKTLTGIEIKNADLGQVRAVFSVFDVTDHDNDVTLKTAFKDGTPVLISTYNHGSWNEGSLPAGKGIIRVEGNTAVLDGQFFLETPQGRATFDTVKAVGDQQEWSYGYTVTDSEPGQVDGKSVRILKGLDVFEVSPVLRGAGIGTRLLSAKAAKAAEADEHAMPDGSYPIADGQALKDAIGVPGRGNDNHDAIRVHIMAQAKRLGLTNLIPDEWKADGSMDSGKSLGVMPRAIRGAIPTHQTDTLTKAWNATKTVDDVPADARPSELRTVYAWVDPDGDPEAKTSYRFAHHHGVGGPANIRACLIGIAGLNGQKGDPGIPEADRKAVYDHLAGHLTDADREPPTLRTADGDSKSMRFGDEASDVLASVSSLIDRATEVMALRNAKNKGMSPVAADLLSWVADDMKRLMTLLEAPVEDDTNTAADDDSALSVLLAAMARVNGM